MFTISDAVSALQLCSRSDAPLKSLGALCAHLGFRDPLGLVRRDLAGLGVSDPGARGAVAVGEGSLRALLLEFESGASLREHSVELGRRLPRTSPGLHWLIVARRKGSTGLLIAAPSPDACGALPALLVDSDNLRGSDAETLAALVAAADGVDVLVHLRWREALGREALSRRFYQDLERAVDTLATTAIGRANTADRRTLALRTTSRLLFLSFLEAKGWLAHDRAFLRRHLERCAGGAGLHRRLLDPLFFGTLNTRHSHRSASALAFGSVPFLNGGLFTRTGVETRCRDLRFTDDAIGLVIGDLLTSYRITARETSDSFSDAAVDPEMLGRAFESLMTVSLRRTRGTFYTPYALIGGLVRNALDALPPLTQARSVRVIDPACGSGAFLVFALEEIATRLIAAGDSRPTSDIRKEVLTRCVFGVDVDPTAVWLCQLRLWLSVVVEDERAEPMRLPPLPNLDRNVREGDALAGEAFDDVSVIGDPRFRDLRLRYTRSSGVRKRTLGRLLDDSERRRAIDSLDHRMLRIATERRELLLAARSPDLFQARRGTDAETRRALAHMRSDLRGARAERRRLLDRGALPFSFATHFADVAEAGGFDAVIGNPPWVRPHAVAKDVREELRSRFETLRHAAWEAGAFSSGAGRGFASQADLSALFCERALQLARPGGVISLLLPSKLWSALAGGGVRRLLLRRTSVMAIADWGGDAAGFDAAVYPSSLLARVTERRDDRSSERSSERSSDCSPISASPEADESEGVIDVTRHESEMIRSWRIPISDLALDRTDGAPWLLIPADVRSAFDALVEAGIPLSDSSFGRPLLGVKSGCNSAFLVRREDSHRRSAVSAVRSGARLGEVEEDMLRPLLRGEHVRAWRVSDDAAREAILWTHDEAGMALSSLPTNARRWLSHWRRELESRSDARGPRWWSLYRTECARHDRARVVWGDIGLTPRTVVLRAGDRTVPLNTCYVVSAPSEDDAHALAAILNSTVASAWLGVIAEPARGGYRRYLGWTCSRLPIPRDWSTARRILAPLGRAGAAGAPPESGRLDRAVLRAYGLRGSRVGALLRW